MKAINSDILIENLQADVRELILKATLLEAQPKQILEKQPAPGKWSVAQTLEHLNIYARYYITAMEERLHLHHTKAQPVFRPGWFGNYFTNMMKPGAGNVVNHKMKTFKNAEPTTLPDLHEMLSEFLQHQHHLLNLLQLSRSANISSIRVPISLSKYVKLKLGDTFRFFIAHEQRHFVQIENTLNC
ncbi:MAG: DinB family protein [Bacteroidetes bacterium]|nr:DinB family protein [Bacteroidota bacterium]